jgi:hypothetical protein
VPPLCAEALSSENNTFLQDASSSKVCQALTAGERIRFIVGSKEILDNKRKVRQAKSLKKVFFFFLCFSMLLLPSTDPSTSRGDISRDIVGTSRCSGRSSNDGSSSLHIATFTTAVRGNSSSNTQNGNATDSNEILIICVKKKNWCVCKEQTTLKY